VLVRITDTGEGISSADQQKIFDKFFSVSKHGRPEAPGNGLGLCLARSIARAHRGDIVVDSEINKGSVFTVSIPLSA
jgi:signal transduction histidine kinase